MGFTHTSASLWGADWEGYVGSPFPTSTQKLSRPGNEWQADLLCPLSSDTVQRCNSSTRTAGLLVC